MSNLEERSNISKSQFNRTRSISVQPQNIRITFLLSKFMRMKRELHKKRLNNNSVNRIKNVQHSTNINYRVLFLVDSGTGETPNLPANQETTEANSGTANGENTLNNGENSKTDESNKNEENGTTTETPVDPEEEGEVSLEEIEQDQARLDFLIGKVKKLLTDSGDYIMSVLLRILKEHLRKYSFGSRFMEKVKEMAKKYQGNVLVAKQELEKRLGRKFGKKFRMMLIKLLRTLVVGGTLPK
ncbi:GSCOCG00011551001-RA-CDS [Cotesia congregata]|nr:GSCOCG00011551001-RA-CDS [Cotesia congregata]